MLNLIKTKEAANAELSNQIVSIAQCITEEADAFKLCDAMRNMVVGCREDCRKLGLVDCAKSLAKKFAGCLEAANTIEFSLK